jgi:hypothetical protein
MAINPCRIPSIKALQVSSSGGSNDAPGTIPILTKRPRKPTSSFGRGIYASIALSEDLNQLSEIMSSQALDHLLVMSLSFRSDVGNTSVT